MIPHPHQALRESRWKRGHKWKVSHGFNVDMWTCTADHVSAGVYLLNGVCVGRVVLGAAVLDLPEALFSCPHDGNVREKRPIEISEAEHFKAVQNELLVSVLWPCLNLYSTIMCTSTNQMMR